MCKELSDKLYHFQAAPPAAVWDKIAVALDDKLSGDFVQRLATYEAKPTQDVWNRIEKRLDEKQAPVVPFSSRFSRVIRYTSAAAVILVAALLINLLLNKKTESEGTSAFSPQNNSIIPPGKAIESNKQQQQEEYTTAFYQPKTERKNREPRVAPLKVSRPAFNETALVLQNKQPIVQADVLDRYVLFSKASGEAVRLSKKLFALFACADDKENCKEDIESVQKKMASPELMASTDFTGMLDMLQNMNNQ